ncbi:MAG TPA: ribonuclease P protein component [Stellaceae bacterium]|jgi:ribonuclease P protein component|nr:ribonuclease P protein component [Stellaceae bacterium]
MSPLPRLKRRAEFLRIAGSGRKSVTPGLILQVAPRPVATAEARASLPALRVGFTASRKVGIAVERNRARRRLRAAVAQVMALHAAPDRDYVLVARAATVRRPFAALKGDLETALRQTGAYRDAPS